MAKAQSTSASTGTVKFKLTAQQGAVLLSHVELNPMFKSQLEAASGGAKTFELTGDQLVGLVDDIYYAREDAHRSIRPKLVALAQKFMKLSDDLLDDPTCPKRPRPADDELLFQFRIKLLGIWPPIWRRIQVADCSLLDLHYHIQRAMGWECAHTFAFRIDGRHYLDEPDYGEKSAADSFLSNLVPKSGKRVSWTYQYDFGDDWRHAVLFEGYPYKKEGETYPICTAGARACPLEDIGGPQGYSDYLSGEGTFFVDLSLEGIELACFEPEAFDSTEATQRMRRSQGDSADPW